jgi:CDP-glycerol glycerophosphotransferase (TagB/SpsB family)
MKNTYVNKFYEKYSTIALQVHAREMQNIIVIGYPIYDEYQEAKFNTSIWKVADDNLKRIIWAPHHSIEGNNGLLKLSTFLENADSMLDIARKFHEKVQFAFKPHPMLLQVLYNHPKWGKEKTDKYYKEWENGKNTILTTGSYMELFKSSDAMIHDCGSFIIEYLYTKKQYYI